MTPFDSDLQFDFLILGSGVAGLSCAVELAPFGTVAVLTKEDLSEGSTQWAQGGIAAALAPEPLDSAELHLQDTMQAGAGLCDREAVQVLVEEGPRRIRQLISRGTHFDTDAQGELLLTREAAHRARRIVHAQGDSTGREVQRSLGASTLQSAGVTIFEHTCGVDLLREGERVVGVAALNEQGQVQEFRARAVILATGGIGALYKVTTNPPVLTGDGIAMAYRAGAELSDMEFVQFHPTAFAKGPDNPKFLISEAVRGEGALLLNSHGERFMPAYHVDAELAPRDVVSRAIAEEILKTGADFVTLDLRQYSAQQIAQRFPKIYATCVAYGIDPALEPIPVSPAEHYMMGGVRTDLDGRTNVPGLLACGECACTGVHGANRLASNSMLEGLVFGTRLVDAAIEEAENAGAEPVGAHGVCPLPVAPQEVTRRVPLQDARARLQLLMWRHAGLVRDGDGLREALRELDGMQEQFGTPTMTRDSLELANMICVARLVVQAAIAREESRGAHFRRDFPRRDDAHWKCHLVLTREGDDVRVERVKVA